MEKLVHIVPRYGVIITEIAVPEQMMVVEMRKALEPLIASRAARRSTVSEKIEIASYRVKLLDTVASGDVLEYLRMHFIIRRYVAACTRNKLGRLAAADRRAEPQVLLRAPIAAGAAREGGQHDTPTSCTPSRPTTKWPRPAPQTG